MDLNILFENIGSIATSLERIADSLEQRTTSTVSVSASGDTVTTTTEAPKRKRRTKAGLPLTPIGSDGYYIPIKPVPATKA